MQDIQIFPPPQPTHKKHKPNQNNPKKKPPKKEYIFTAKLEVIKKNRTEASQRIAVSSTAATIENEPG